MVLKAQPQGTGIFAQTPYEAAVVENARVLWGELVRHRRLGRYQGARASSLLSGPERGSILQHLQPRPFSRWQKRVESSVCG